MKNYAFLPNRARFNPDRMGRRMRSMEKLQKRVNDAGIRLVITEIESVSSLLAEIDQSPDPEERVRRLRDAEAAVDFASRVARTLEFPDSQGEEVSNQIQQLRDRLDQLFAMDPESSAPQQMR
jgi:hypothetical protein